MLSRNTISYNTKTGRLNSYNFIEHRIVKSAKGITMTLTSHCS